MRKSILTGILAFAFTSVFAQVNEKELMKKPKRRLPKSRKKIQWVGRKKECSRFY
ncbi:MAG: hypothetical protein M0D53_07365 [Flavobacterium sp. JAD_PAG50586_2]|nr:MAG: hypothetical protein M0D53_07365 [Flavobacterium sp. JAD_PAG50586_2]